MDYHRQNIQENVNEVVQGLLEIFLYIYLILCASTIYNIYTLFCPSVLSAMLQESFLLGKCDLYDHF